MDQAAGASGSGQELIASVRSLTIAAAALIGAAVSVFAADDEANEKRCDGNTREIVACLIGRTEVLEKRMAAAYEQAVNDANAEQRPKMEMAQKLWLQFRQANCEYYSRGSGTWASIQAGYCMMDLTAARAHELESATERH